MADDIFTVQRKPLSWREMTRQAMAEEARKQAPMGWEVPVDQLYAPSSDVPVSGGFAPGGAVEPTIQPEDIAALIPWKTLAKAGARGVGALSEELGAAMMRPSSYEITAPIKNVGHLSTQTKLKLKAPSEVHPNLRYDSGHGVFGRNTYFDETGDWIGVDGRYNLPGARGIAGDVVYSADLAPKKALLITPNNISKLQKKGLLPEDTRQIAEYLQPKGYDSVVIRGMDTKIDEAGQKFSNAADKLFEKVKNNKLSKEGYFKQRSKLYDDIFTKNFGKVGSKAESYQDQIVVFDPTKTVSRFEQLGPKQTITKEMIQKGEKSPYEVERPLSSFVKRKVDKLQKISTRGHSLRNYEPSEQQSKLYSMYGDLLDEEESRKRLWTEMLRESEALRKK